MIGNQLTSYQGYKMAEFLTKDSFEYRLQDANAKRQHYGNRASYEKSKGRLSNASADNAMANMAEIEAETIAQRMNKANSRAQYDHERQAGDPNALKLSFEQWKKL